MLPLRCLPPGALGQAVVSSPCDQMLGTVPVFPGLPLCASLNRRGEEVPGHMPWHKDWDRVTQ